MKLGIGTKSMALDGQRSASSVRTPGTNELAPGCILDDLFLIEEVLGEGGTSTIFKAKILEEGEDVVALKIPHWEYEMGMVNFSRFNLEEQIGFKFSHPQVVRFIESNKQKSRPFIIMEYVEGCTLHDVLKMFQVLPEEDAIFIATRICEALIHIHSKSVYHLDIKPANVMIATDGSIRIVDFGLARAMSLPEVSLNSAVGTPDYIAPERICRKKGDARTDIYSLGTILYQMLTGVIPHSGDNPDVLLDARVTGDPVPPREINPSISPQIEEIVLHALERRPSDRYQTVDEFLLELREPRLAKMEGRSKSREPSTPWKRVARKVTRLMIWLLVPLLLQVMLFFFLKHHFTKG